MKRKAATIAGVVFVVLLAGALLNSEAFGGGNPILDIILEAIHRIDSRIDSLDTTVTEQQQQISELQSKLDALNRTLTSRIEALEFYQSVLAERIAMLEDEVYGSEGVTFLNDRFDTGLDNWSYWGEPGYVLQWISNAAVISGDGYNVLGGMQKVVDLSEWDGSGVLMLSFDWRATSDMSESGCTNAHLFVHDADSGSSLYIQHLIWGGTTDTGWLDCVSDISSYVLGHPRIRIILHLGDGWSQNWHQTNAYDNIKLTSTTPP